MSINFNCKINVKHDFKNINTIIQRLPQTANEFIEDILKNIRGYAIRLEKGHKKDGILFELVEIPTMKSKGRVYADPNKFMTDNNQSYLWFEYFGTRTIC